MKKNIFIITGGNRGLGKALIDLLIKDSDNFIISISRNLNEIQKTYPKKNFHFIRADLSKKKLTKKLLILNDLIRDQKIYFINNAGVIKPIMRVQHFDEDIIDKNISVNIKAPMLITAFLISNFNHNKLVFTNISSGAASSPIANWSLYCSSKAFIKIFFEVTEKENSHYTFHNINPGVIDTKMQKTIRDSSFPDSKKFINMYSDGKLKSANEAALEIFNIIK